MIKLLVAISAFLLIPPSFAESKINIRVKNIPIGSYFVLFEEPLESNERVGLIGQSYFNDKGIFLINNGFSDGNKVVEVIVKDRWSGLVDVTKKIVISKDSLICGDVVVYDWLIECNTYSDQ